MKKRCFLTALLCLVLAFSILLGSCAQEPEPPVVPPEAEEEPEETTPPEKEYSVTEALKNSNLILYVYCPEYIQKAYVVKENIDWWHGLYDLGGLYQPADKSSNNRMEFKEWEISDYPLEPGDKVVIMEKYEYSDMTVTPAVYQFLGGWDISKRTLLITGGKRSGASSSEGSKNFEETCKEYFSGITRVENTGYYLWEGTAEDFKAAADKIMKSDQNKWFFEACFHEDFLNIYGFTIEQALILIQNGHLFTNFKAEMNSPLYKLTPTEIAAYLTEHPEILEE